MKDLKIYFKHVG